MKLLHFVIFILTIIIVLVSGCTKTPPPAQTAIIDTPDRDFIVNISKTEKPLVFDVEIKRVNYKVDKMIWDLIVIVDLTLTDSSGKIIKAERGDMPKYANILSGIPKHMTTKSRYRNSLKGQIRLNMLRERPASTKLSNIYQTVPAANTQSFGFY